MSAQKPIIDRAVQIHLGCELRTLYGNPAEERLPQNLARLLDRVAQVIRAHPTRGPGLSRRTHRQPEPLRAFAISLTHDVPRAEDLVQETVLRAISKHEKFEAGTNLPAWLMTILRNQFYSGRRRTQREVEDAEGFTRQQ